MRTAQEQQAIESLERWGVQMEDLIDTGVFGDHKAHGCLSCRATRIRSDMRDLIAKMSLPNAQDHRAGEVEP
jgi:hypothetical protein